jgi:cytochrome oxidase Cu insertion factor (SCO1/SenC/PrrC family)
MKRMVALVAVVAFFGLGGASTAVATRMTPGAPHAAPATSLVPVPVGYHKVTVKKAGLSIAVPDAWLTLDPTRKDIDKIFKQLRKAAPELAAALPEDVSELTAQGLTFLAVDASGGVDFHANVNVILAPLVASLPTPEAARAALQDFMPNAEAKKTRVAGVRAVETAGTFAIGATTIHSTSYFVFGKNGLLQITFSGLEDGRQDPTVQTMISSLKLLR